MSGRPQYESVPTDGQYTNGAGGGGQQGGFMGAAASMFGTHPAQGQYELHGAPDAAYGQPMQADAQGLVGHRGGPPASATLKNMQTTHGLNMVCFAASVGIIVGAFFCSFVFFFDFSPVDYVNMTYIMMFGVIMGILDTPFFKTIKMVVQAKEAIGKYVNILTRVTGKGIAFVFLGSSLLSAMFANYELISNPFMTFFGTITNVSIILVGIMCITIGTMKSQKLNRAQKQLVSNFEKKFPDYAHTYRGEARHEYAGGGLTPEEFNAMCKDLTGFQWEDTDLKLIFNALNTNPAWRSTDSSTRSGEPMIPFADLKEWVYNGLVWL